MAKDRLAPAATELTTADDEEVDEMASPVTCDAAASVVVDTTRTSKGLLKRWVRPPLAVVTVTDSEYLPATVSRFVVANVVTEDAEVGVNTSCTTAPLGVKISAANDDNAAAAFPHTSFGVITPLNDCPAIKEEAIELGSPESDHTTVETVAIMVDGVTVSVKGPPRTKELADRSDPVKICTV
jgi:hypothetical protein